MDEAVETAKAVAKAVLTEPERKLYPLDQLERTVAIEVPSRNLTILHKLRRATIGELIERDTQTPFETEEINTSEDRMSIDDVEPNARLWDKTGLEVKGYRYESYKADDWIPVTSELAAQIPSGHKATAIRSLYQMTFELEMDEEAGFALGASTFVIKQTFGDYVIRHFLRAPTEAERREFRRKATETRFTRGSRKVRTKVVSHLRIYADLYDKAMTDIDGVAVDDAPINNGSMAVSGNRALCLELMDAAWKRGVIDCLMRSLEASMSD
jgi:hypothetical protein